MRHTGAEDHKRNLNPAMARTMVDNIAIFRHAQFWDRQNKGYITPIDAVAGLMHLGYGTLFSIFIGGFLGAIVAYATQDTWLMPDPRCRIYIDKLIHAKRRRQGDMYDIDGKLNLQHFDRLYDKYARWDMSGNTMTLSEAVHMASEHGSFGVSPAAWTRATIEWLLLYVIASKGGAFEKTDIQAAYDGSLFYKLCDAHQKPKPKQAFGPSSKPVIRRSFTTTVVPIVQEPTARLAGVKIPLDDSPKGFGTRFSCFVKEPKASVVKDEVLALTGLRRAVRFDDAVSEARYDEDKPVSILGIFVPEPRAQPKVPAETGGLGLFDGLLRPASRPTTGVPEPAQDDDTGFRRKQAVLEPVVLSGLLPTDAATDFVGFVPEPRQGPDTARAQSVAVADLSRLRADGVLHGLAKKSTDKPIKNWLNTGLLPGVQSTPDTFCYAAPSAGGLPEDYVEDHFDAESDTALLAGMCKPSGEAVKNWLNTPAITGAHTKRPVHEDDAKAGAGAGARAPAEDQKTLSGNKAAEAILKECFAQAGLYSVDMAEDDALAFNKKDEDGPPPSREEDMPNGQALTPEPGRIAAEMAELDDDDRSVSTPSDTATGDNSPELMAHQENERSRKVMLNDDDWPLLVNLAAQREE